MADNNHLYPRYSEGNKSDDEIKKKMSASKVNFHLFILVLVRETTLSTAMYELYNRSENFDASWV